MIWRLAILVCALALFQPVAMAQSRAERQAEESTEILVLVRQLELLNQLLPVLLTKEQISELLPPIEKVRSDVRKAEDAEYKRLREMQPKLEEAVEKGIQERQVTGVEILGEIDKNLRVLGQARQVIANINIDTILAIVDTSWNAGQKKVAANTLSPSLFDPTLDPATMTEEQKLRMFVSVVLLDPLAYDLLLRMREHAPSASAEGS